MHGLPCKSKSRRLLAITLTVGSYAVEIGVAYIVDVTKRVLRPSAESAGPRGRIQRKRRALDKEPRNNELHIQSSHNGAARYNLEESYV